MVEFNMKNNIQEAKILHIDKKLLNLKKFPYCGFAFDYIFCPKHLWKEFNGSELWMASLPALKPEGKIIKI